jgi:hypothetical protein
LDILVARFACLLACFVAVLTVCEGERKESKLECQCRSKEDDRRGEGTTAKINTEKVDEKQR